MNKKLEQELERSLALQELWPGVFGGEGKVTSYLVGSYGRRALVRGRFRNVQEIKHLVVKSGIGEERQFASDLIPTALRGGM